MSTLNVIQCDGCPMQCELIDGEPPAGWVQFAESWKAPGEEWPAAAPVKDLCPECAVRLQNAIQHALNRKPAVDCSMFNESLDDVEHRHILNVLHANKWNKSRSAEILGIERSTLDRKLRRYKVERPAAAALAPACQQGASTL